MFSWHGAQRAERGRMCRRRRRQRLRACSILNPAKNQTVGRLRNGRADIFVPARSPWQQVTASGPKSPREIRARTASFRSTAPSLRLPLSLSKESLGSPYAWNGYVLRCTRCRGIIIKRLLMVQSTISSLLSLGWGPLHLHASTLSTREQNSLQHKFSANCEMNLCCGWCINSCGQTTENPEYLTAGRF